MARPPGPDSGRGSRPFRRQAQAAAQSPSRARSEERAGKALVMTAANIGGWKSNFQPYRPTILRIPGLSDLYRPTEGFILFHTPVVTGCPHRS